MTAVVNAAAFRPTHPPTAAATALPLSEESAGDRRRYVQYPVNGITNARLRQFAPIAVTPPSPKSRAWMTRAMLMESIAPQGPTAIAIKTPPTAWPVLPPGRGTLNIITRKENAAEMARRGALRVSRLSLTLRAAIAQRGEQAAEAARYVGGPRYPSGICISSTVSCLVSLPPVPGLRAHRAGVHPPSSPPKRARVIPARKVTSGDALVVPHARLVCTLSSRSWLPTGRPAMVAPALAWTRTAPTSQSAMTGRRPLAGPAR